MRRFSEALLFALLLIAVQTAILTHDHGDPQAPAGAAAQACEFCVGNHSAAPAAELAAAARHAAPPLLLSMPETGPPQPIRPPSAHRSRAPPALRSV